MAYNILIDTSIFVNQCFCFDNYYFKSLSRLRQAGLINLFITDVVKAEVENRIKFSIENGEKVVRKEAHILGAYLNIKPKDIINDLFNKFQHYIAVNCTILTVPEYFIGKKIINNYLNNNPPFDKAKEIKKQEFPDAFIIETFANYLEKNDLKGVFLSKDKDCMTYINNNDRIEYTNDIGTLLDKLNRENKEYTTLISQAINNRASNLAEILNNFVANLDFDNYDYDTHEFSHYSFYDFDISSLDFVPNSLDFSRTEYGIYDIDSEENYVQLSIPVTYQISSVLVADDYDNASYDKEDDKYYFVENIVVDNRFIVEDVEIVVGLDLNTRVFEILSQKDEINAEFNIDEPIEEEEINDANS